MGFLASREFAIGASVGLLLAAAALLGPTVAPALFDSWGQGRCDEPTGSPVPLADGSAAPSHGSGTYTAPAPAQLVVCVVVGHVKVLTHDADHASVEVTIRDHGSSHLSIAEATQVQVRMDGHALVVAQTHQATRNHWVGGGDEDVTVTVYVPAGRATSYQVEAGVGSISASGLSGGADGWSVGVGDAQVSYASLAGSVDVDVSVGDLRLSLPVGPAYSIEASTDVGGIQNLVVGFDLDDRDNTPPGESIRGHTPGDSPVGVRATVSVGDIVLQSSR